jgi:ferredoxin
VIPIPGVSNKEEFDQIMAVYETPQPLMIREAQMFPAIMNRLAPSQAMVFMKNAIATVDECIECGECEEKCPYNLPIVEMLRRHAEGFRELEASLGRIGDARSERA